MTNKMESSQKRVLPHSLKLSLGLGLGLWMITANGLNTSPTIVSHAVSPLAEIDDQNFTLYGANDEKLKHQRALFKQTEYALNKRHYRTFEKLLPQLEDYPLYPYLQFRKMRKNPGKLDRETIDSFFNQYGDNQITARLRTKLLKYYARNARWDDFLHLYQDQTSVTMQCHHLTALLHTHQKETALALVEPLWLSAKSQPKACNTIFNAWQEAGLQTAKLTWQRIALAMSKGRTQLAGHLAKSLNPIDRKWVSLWIKAHRAPDMVLKHPDFSLSHPMASTIQLHAVKRQLRKDINKAVDLWTLLAETNAFTEQEKYTAFRLIGLKMARTHHPDAESWLSQIPLKYTDNEVTEWLIRSSIRHANWQLTLDSIESLPAHKQADLRWQFWWAYASEQLGHKLDADGIYHYLANRRSYYGFLAADRLDLPYAFENRPLDIDAQKLANISHYPEII
ncbi:MAG: hypothetical protein OQK76_06775, partial [Gammaproteobacteria bacterium]|nr:hypothetical protein [Gammaproteobacteria bacterium]